VGLITRALSSSGWLLLERAWLLGVGLAVSIVLARALGPAGFGELNYLLAIVGLLLPISQLGINGLVSRALLEYPRQQQVILNTALSIRAAGCLLALLLGFLYWIVGEASDPDRIVLLVLLFAHSATAAQVLEFWFQVRLRSAALVPWRASVVTVAALVKIWLALRGGSVQLVALVFAAEYLLLGAAYLGAFRSVGGPWVVPKARLAWLGWFARRAPWLILSGVAAMVYLKIDIIMLERMRGAGDAGIYAVAARLSEAWYVVPVALMASLFTAIWARRSRPEDYQRSLQATLDGLVAIAFVLAICIQFLAMPVIVLLFGDEYRPAAAVLTLHIWAGLFVFPRALVSRWILAEDLLRFSLVTQVAGAVVNVAFNLVLIPRNGPLGAAIATVFSYAAAAWLALFLDGRTRPMAYMLTRALLLPFRWADLMSYARFIAHALVRRR
jgi:O-antigen/teichoic acid export membrane protein